MESIPLRRCTKCENEYPASLQYFSAQKTVKSGLRSICKICNKAYDAAHAGLKNERKKALRRSNPEIAERRREQERAYIHKNAEVVSIRKKAYYDTHPEQRRIEAHNRRARERAVGGKHTVKDVQDQFQRQKGKCYYCKTDLANGYEIDHIIPISRGGSNGIDNIVLACPGCNACKYAKLPHEWPEGNRLL